jgi:hypothetical protein
VSEMTSIVRNLDGIPVSGKMGDVGTMRVSRAESALLTSARGDHLRVGTHERDRDFGAG